jgi:hypothetical protein
MAENERYLSVRKQFTRNLMMQKQKWEDYRETSYNFNNCYFTDACSFVGFCSEQFAGS